MRAEAGIASPEEISDEKTHRRRRRRRRHSHRTRAVHKASGVANSLDEKRGHHTGHDREEAGEIDLEAGLGHRNGHVH